MPELPEVETVRLGLEELIVSKTIKSVDSNWPKSFPNDPLEVRKFVVGSQITGINRRAKILIINLSSGYSLVIHLKMTGQLVYRSESTSFGAGHPNDSLIGLLPDKSTRVIIEFSDNSTLFFNDQRRFGWIKLIKTTNIKQFTSIYGPEPLEDSFTWQELGNRLNLRPKSGIKAVLLDQQIIAGIGNIYADESLWAAKIHPLTPVSELSTQKIKLLRNSIVDVLNLSIKMGGSSTRNYVNAEGKRGSYIKIAKVFRRENEPCPRCGHIISKIRVAGRGTHYCPYCQSQNIAKMSK